MRFIVNFAFRFRSKSSFVFILFIMSWDTYVQNLIDGGMKDGAIAGLENGGWMVAASGSHVIIINLPIFVNLSSAFHKMIQKYIEVKGWKATYAVVNFGYSSGTDGGTESKMRKRGEEKKKYSMRQRPGIEPGIPGYFLY